MRYAARRQYFNLPNGHRRNAHMVMRVVSNCSSRYEFIIITKCASDHISFHVLAWTDAGRPQSRVEAGPGSVRPLPCPGADRQATPGAGPISDPGRLRLDR